MHNILNNIAQACLKLKRYDEVLAVSQEMLPTETTSRELLTMYGHRVLYCRALAYEALNMYAESYADLLWLLRSYISGRQPPGLPERPVVAAKAEKMKSLKEQEDAQVVWQKVSHPVNEDVFIPRHHHASALHPDDIGIFVYGGITVINELEPTDRSLYLLKFPSDTEEAYSWSKLKCKGAKPPALTAHTLVEYKRKLWLLGGETLSVKSALHFYCLDVDTLTWSRVESSNPKDGPGSSGVDGHSALVYGNNMVVFGGYSMSVDGIMDSNSLYLYDFENNMWSRPATELSLQPSPRRYHAAWIAKNDRLFIFGGGLIEQEMTYCADMFEYDLTTNRWLGKVDIANTVLKPRAEIQVACFKGRAAYLFGGYSDDMRFGGSAYLHDGLRFDHGEEVSCCGLLPVGDDCPSRRASATFTIDHVRKKAVLIGGYATSRFGMDIMSDIWTCNVSRKVDSVKNTSRIVDCSYCRQPAVCRACSRCQQMKYCSKQCQKADWPEHKSTCKK